MGEKHAFQKERLVDYWRSSGIIRDERLFKAFMDVKRSDFILEEYSDESYEDSPLPIGSGQTISQPTTVMIMLDALRLNKTDLVLEVGTGSGYNAALISKIAKRVISVETIDSLTSFAKSNLSKEGIKNVEVILGDGSKGYKNGAPYDKIIVTAACPKIPPPLIDQLKEGGIIVAPVGSIYSQKMVKGIKKGNGIETHSLGDFVFVPLIGEFGFN